ncbi:sigma-70 family RNA polymerase sigma factor [Gimesia fumaroli]|uniref:RNA polymerase sigma factor n=1 Tax=Gimesia fumaroli TaxID=2527976 RepID=A0A518IEC2_9PLAN|nr:sigma-70 family RNA polymerase sigma factor [Gimesia fumaroli]QDV51452.1 RNA polymerase sigma factor [Gimesia fumaroli]
MPTETGSQSEVARLLTQYRRALYAYIYACVRNSADADDVFQEVSIAVVESFSQLETEAGFFPWAREIAHRRVLAHQRKSNREKPLNPQVLSALSEATERVENQRPLSTRREKLQECLERLPSLSRELIARCYNDQGESVGMVAEQFGQKVSAVYARMHRIRVILRDCISQRLQEEAAE